MNIRIKTIKGFLDSYRHYTKELMNEYQRLSKHPYPEEYKEYQKNLNNYRNDINTAI